MPTRTYKPLGKAWSTTDDVAVQGTITFNGDAVYTGDLTSTNGTPDNTIDFSTLQDLCSWDGEVVYGTVPFEIEVTQGTLLFSSIKMNYLYEILSVEIKPDAAWTGGYTPADADEVVADMQAYTSTHGLAPITESTTDVSEKYGMTWAAVKANLNETVVTSAADNFEVPWPAEKANERITNPRLDGAPMDVTPAVPDDEDGNWYYMIPPGSSFTANIVLPAQ